MRLSILTIFYDSTIILVGSRRLSGRCGGRNSVLDHFCDSSNRILLLGGICYVQKKEGDRLEYGCGFSSNVAMRASKLTNVNGESLFEPLSQVIYIRKD